MKDLILKAVNGRENESRAIILLLSVGFLTGIFIATFDVGAITLFLKYFDEKKDIPRAFFISGILGVSVTYIFGQLQKVISYKYITWINDKGFRKNSRLLSRSYYMDF